jgi:anti-sigma factor RsiW
MSMDHLPASCARFDELLMASVDRTLDGAEHAEYDAHLAACPPCVTKLQQYVLTTQILQGVGVFEELEAAPPLAESLIERILTARRTAEREGRRTG